MTADQTTVTAGHTPDLSAYDVVLVNSSAGEDSQASLDVVVENARAAAVLDKVVVVHADLCDAEWEGETTPTDHGRVTEAERDRLDAGAPVCRQVRPGTLGFQLCWREDHHRGDHESQDGQTWTGQ